MFCDVFLCFLCSVVQITFPLLYSQYIFPAVLLNKLYLQVFFLNLVLIMSLVYRDIDALD